MDDRFTMNHPKSNPPMSSPISSLVFDHQIKKRLLERVGGLTYGWALGIHGEVNT